MARESSDVQKYFPDAASRSDSKTLHVEELPYLTRPIIEAIHTIQPDVVVAGDRGARLSAVTALRSWRHRFPGQRFPTIDGSIHFARVTGRDAAKEQVEEAVHAALDRAGLAEWRRTGDWHNGESPKVLYMDDSTANGGAIGRFVSAANSYGIPSSALTCATMYGLPAVCTIDHILADPSRDPEKAVWDSHLAETPTESGVRFLTTEPTVPLRDPNPSAVDARKQLLGCYNSPRKRVDGYVDQYYADFTVALAAGKISLDASGNN